MLLCCANGATQMPKKNNRKKNILCFNAKNLKIEFYYIKINDNTNDKLMPNC